MHRRFLILVLILVLVFVVVIARRNFRGESSIATYFNSLWQRIFPSQDAMPAAKYNVGFSVLDIKSRGRDLKLAVWYPTSDQPKSYIYIKDVAGNVALNGRVLFSRSLFPLVVFSHGAFSGALQSAYLMEYLASQGYILAAPDHQDACLVSADPSKRGVSKCPEIVPDTPILANLTGRPEDIKASIDFLLGQSAVFTGKIDSNRVAVMGHSAGGTTALAVSGVSERGVANYKDSRIKACLMLAPHVMYIESEEYKKMNNPVIYIWGQFDQNHLLSSVPRLSAYTYSLSPKILVIPKLATHFIFSDYPTCIPYGSTTGCIQNNVRVRTVLTYLLTFMGEYLPAGPNMLNALNLGSTNSDNMLLEYRKE